MRCFSLFCVPLLISVAAGCSSQSPENPAGEARCASASQSQTPAVGSVTTTISTHEQSGSDTSASPDAKVLDLFAKYNSLPGAAKDSLKGDKLMMEIERLLMLGTSPSTKKLVAQTLTIHNRKMVQRAMEDTSADPIPEVSGTEFLARPRELK